MLILTNATVSTTRKNVAVLTNVAVRIWPLSLTLQIQMGMSHRSFHFLAPRTLDIQPGDVMTGWNPTNQASAPSFVVRQVVPRDGLLGHLAGVLEVYGTGAFTT